MADQEQLAGADAAASTAALAMALGRKPRGPRTDGVLDTLLEKQSRLIDLQIENLESDRAIQHRHLALKYFGDRLRIGLQLLLIAFGLIVFVGLIALAWQAHEDHGLVIEAFSVPPDLARDGLTGEVAAARFLDKLQAMQTSTRSERPADSYQNNWGSQIKVEIPQTGLTFGEIETLLRDKLGHASHVTGEVIRTPAGIAVTARLGAATPQTFAGGPSDFDALAQQAAEAGYRTSQPYRFAQYLDEHGRVPEAFGVISDLAANGPRSERGWAYAQWGLLDLNEHGDVHAARMHSHAGLGFTKASAALAEIGLVSAEVWSGHDEAAWEYSRDVDVKVQKRSLETTEENFETNKLISGAYLASLVGDLQRSASEWRLAGQGRDYYGSRRLSPALVATTYALDHDLAAAQAAVEATQPNDDVSFLQLDAEGAFSALPAYWIAAERGDWPAALADVRGCDAWLEGQKPTHKVLGLLQPVWIHPLEALAMARTGDVAGAQALIATTPLDCYLCLRVRGQIAAQARDWPTAERWFADAAHQAPSLPFAWSEWGQMRLAKGDLAGAIAVFQIAHEKGPHFADPLKGWGDALARQGRWSDARVRYDEALKYAPAWRALLEHLRGGSRGGHG